MMKIDLEATGEGHICLSLLRKHEKLHSAERPFACDICTKAFTTHAHLKGNHTHVRLLASYFYAP